VFVVCAALTLTVKLLVAPTFIVKLAGSNAVTATGGATTLTIAEAVLPFKLAMMPACRARACRLQPGRWSAPQAL